MNLRKLDFKNPEIKTNKLILLAGNGQNVGKTTFGCQLVQHLKKLNQKIYALKISPHIHNQNTPHTIFANEHFILSLEKDKNKGKDSSRYLNAGADESFFLQVKDAYLQDAINYTFTFFAEDVFIIAESGGLRNLLKPNFFFFLKRKEDQILKEKAQKWVVLADRVILFDGFEFNFDVDKIIIENGQIKLID